jgi:hypothetical protein
MKTELYLELKNKVIEVGYASEIDWADDIKPCNNSNTFIKEYIFVVVNSGMKYQIAVNIYHKIIEAIYNGINISEVFKHEGKVRAIKELITNYEEFYHNYQEAEDKLEYLESLPWIGKITKYHLAKNLGMQCIKPDRHLVRIAQTFNKTANQMCEDIQKETGDKLTVIDTVIWRAANLGFI